MAKIYPFTIVNMTVLVLESSETTGSDMTESTFYVYRRKQIFYYNSDTQKHIMDDDSTKEIDLKLKTSGFKIIDINNRYYFES